MSNRQGALLSLALCVALGAQAQTAAPAKPGVKADPKAEEAAAAMERAKRLAAGPMRVILEASKGKRREGEAAPAGAAAAAAPAAASDSSSLRTVSARNNPAPEIAVRSAPAPQPAPVVQAPAPAPAPAPAAATVAAPAPAPAPEPTPAAPAISTQITLSSQSLQGHSVAPVPGLERATSTATLPSLATPTPAALPTLPEAVAKPRLVSRVDPDLPQRMLDDLGRNAVLAVDLSIRANGTVGGVAMVTAVPARVQRALTAALEQWRFDPLPSDRVHRVELVFNND